jgi:3-oxoacyl-[acyl-carrier-protein] synthase II
VSRDAKRRRVFVTGLGVVSPLGLSAQATWDGLLAGRSGIERIQVFDPTDFASKIAGEVRDFEAGQWMDEKLAKRTGRFIHFAYAGARMALEDAALDVESVDRDRFGVVIGSGIGGLELIERQHQLLLERGPRRLSPYLIPGMIINLAGGLISIEYGLKGPNSATVTACATGNHAIGDAFRFIQHGDADIVLAGGTEGVITPMAVGGFCAMRALSTRNDEPEKASRPFDRDRDGFVISEGCGLLVLESEDMVRQRGVKPYAEIVGLGMSGDAFHMSAPPEDGDGMVRVMRAALGDAGLALEEIDYINAHGTSTPTGDAVEVRAVDKVFGEQAQSLYISSSKSAFGHLLGAAGGVESAITCMAIRHGLIPPTLNLDQLDAAIETPEGRDRPLVPYEHFAPHEPVERPIRAALSNSFGFGGTNATLVFRHPDL